jgi:capsular exopolysaccharide synthesis family protein
MENDNNALELDLKRIFSLFKRWLWLLLLCLALGAAAGFVFSLRETPVYQASTKVLISRAAQNQTADVTASLNSVQLAQTYVELVKTTSVAQTIIQRLKLDLSPSALQDMISVSVLRDTQIIQIEVEDIDPQRAAQIANTLVTVLIEQNDIIQSGRYVTMEESLQAQKTQVEAQIASLQNQINQASVRTIDEQKIWIEQQIADLKAESAALQSEISQLSQPSRGQERPLLEQKKARFEQIKTILPLYQQSYNDLVVYGKAVPGAASISDSQLALLRTTQTLYQQIYVSVLSNLESVRLTSLQNTPNVVQIETASAPQDPIRPRIPLNTLLAGLAALLLAASVVFLIDYLDDTLKTPEDIERSLGLNVVGLIADMRADAKEAGIYVARQPRSPIAEAFRSLRTNLEFSGVDKALKTILVTSAGPGDGKTTMAVNLAAVFAQRGQKVVLLDADLRRPRVHSALGISNKVGLTDLFHDGLKVGEVSRPCEGSEMLSVITSGTMPPNPAELLGSAKMLRILEELSAEYDMIVIDSPPSLVADAQVLAARVDGVLLVMQPGKTSVKTLRLTLEQLKRAGARILGVALNRIPRDRGGYYGGYHYDQGYYNSESNAAGTPTPAAARPSIPSLRSLLRPKRKAQEETKN